MKWEKFSFPYEIFIELSIIFYLTEHKPPVKEVLWKLAYMMTVTRMLGDVKDTCNINYPAAISR